MRVGLLPLARATFDVEFAGLMLARMLDRLEGTGADIIGSRDLLFDAAEARVAIEGLSNDGAERILVLQVTFTDAATVAEAAGTGLPLSIWAAPEPRTGGRLRLNAFCGLNLASHALSLRQKRFAWAYGDPGALSEADLWGLLTGSRDSGRLDGTPVEEGASEATGPLRIARIGAHPDGFDTCIYDPSRLEALAGATVHEIGLETLFAGARNVPDSAVRSLRDRVGADLSGLDDLNQSELDRSLRLKAAFSELRNQGNYDAFAIRCWPECFTEYGGAACAPAAMMGEEGVPCACEADVYGALSQVLLRRTSGAPVFLTDLVDMDREDDSAVVWHCGQAPLSMCDPGARAEATIHSNRRMPLLHQFPLKPGRVTLMRVSQAFGAPRLVLARGQMLSRPLAFSGTSGVLRFDRPVVDVLPDLVAAGTEHHLALAYGDHAAGLRSTAVSLGLPVLELA